jgi:acyl carrier protein
MTGKHIPASQLREWIIDYVIQIANISKDDLQPDVLIREELGIDSLKAMEIVATLEKRMGLSIDERQLLNVRTVEDFFQLVERIYNR